MMAVTSRRFNRRIAFIAPAWPRRLPCRTHLSMFSAGLSDNRRCQTACLPLSRCIFAFFAFFVDSAHDQHLAARAARPRPTRAHLDFSRLARRAPPLQAGAFAMALSRSAGGYAA